MIEDEIRIRDRFQFEIKLNYLLVQDKPITHYEIDSYLFIPHNLHVNHGTYSKKTFYQDLQNYIRFKTPSVSLINILSIDEGPLADLVDSISAITPTDLDDATRNFELRIKLFICIAKSALRDMVLLIGNTNDEDDCKHLVRDFSVYTEKITTAFRELRNQLLKPGIPQTIMTIYNFSDEYLSLIVEGHTYRLLDILTNEKKDKAENSKAALRNIISNEIDYRKRRNYPSIPVAKSDNEILIFRRNVLKKYTENVLFLDVSTHSTGKAVEQGLFGVAAGLSMFFATVIHFYSQSVYGALSLPVFFALVIGYIFKDRIKELLRMYFSRKVLKGLFDHKINIYRGNKNNIGYCRESFNFVEDEKVPKQVMRIRARDHITEIESEWMSEDVAYYRKRIDLMNQAVIDAYPGIEISGINDIMRFNISPFVQRSGNPRKDLFLLDGDGYRKIKGERVYHLNLIIKFGKSGQSQFKRFRIIFNRRKIKRIETVSIESEIK